MTIKYKQASTLLSFLAVMMCSVLIQGCSPESDSDKKHRESVSAYWQTVENEPVIVDLLGENQSIQMNDDLHIVKFESVDTDGKTVNVQAVNFGEIWKLTLGENNQGEAELHMFIRDDVEGDLSYVMGLFELEKQMKEQQQVSEVKKAVTVKTTANNAEKITVKDFRLGMTTSNVQDLIKELGKNPDSGWNNCSSNTGSIKPFVEGLAPIQSHLYDQACIVWGYDLIGSLVDVTAIFHSDKLIWAEFNSRGGLSPSNNKALTQALERKYGKPKVYKYADLFGAEEGKKWQIEDALIKLKSSTLILESVKGRQAMESRDNQKNAKAGAVL